MRRSMKGIEICRAFYEEYGAPMLHTQFPEIEGQIAVALTGSGSECLGYDDEVSRDHDFEPGFCLFLPGEELIDRRAAFQLERAYAKLPKEYMGLRRSLMAPVGGARRGVLRMAEFFREKVGEENGTLGVDAWLTLPESALLEATNGEVFRDDAGTFSAIRAQLSAMPEDARKKRLAGNLLLMAQSGQYNYRRCLDHGETGAAQLAAAEFAKRAMAVIFLLNRRYQPFYKWSFRALRELPLLAREGDTLEYLLSTPNDPESAEDKYYAMEDLCAKVIGVLQEQELTAAVCGDLEKHAYSVNDHIEDADMRNRHILYTV